MKIISETHILGLKGRIINLYIHKNGEISYLHILKGDSYIVYKGKKGNVYNEIFRLHNFICENYYSYVINENGKQALIINGKELGHYDSVFDFGSEYNEEKKKDTGNFWYLIKNNNERFIILNGVKLKSYYGINSKYIKFIQDGKALKYRAKRIIDEGKRQWSYVENEKELGWCDTKVELNYSMEVKYVGKKLTCFRSFNNIFYPHSINLCIDKVNARLYKNIYEFYKSDILETYVLVLYKKAGVGINRSRVVHNGNLSCEYESIEWEDFIYNEKEDFLVYIGQRNDKFYLVIGNKEYGCYDQVEGLTYDYFNKSNKFAFKARLGKDWFIVINGKRQKENYKSFGNHMLEFGKRDGGFAYIIKKGDKYHTIINGKIGKGYDEIPGTHVGRYKNTYNYWALDGNKRVYVKDGIEYDSKIINLFDYLNHINSNIPEYFKNIKIKTFSDPFFVIKNIIINEKNYTFDKIENLEYIKEGNFISFIGHYSNDSNIYLLQIGN